MCVGFDRRIKDSGKLFVSRFLIDLTIDRTVQQPITWQLKGKSKLTTRSCVLHFFLEMTTPSTSCSSFSSSFCSVYFQSYRASAASGSGTWECFLLLLLNIIIIIILILIMISFLSIILFVYYYLVINYLYVLAVLYLYPSHSRFVVVDI